jgi:hypothetical protein
VSNAVIIPENIVALSHAVTVGSSDASASMAGANMASEKPSKFWRSESNWPTKCAVTFYTQADTAFAVNAFAIVGHNLKRGDQYRIWVKESSSGATRPNGVTLDNPTGTVAGLTTNTTGTYADVDNGETLTLGTFAGPSAGTEGSPWSIGLSFPTPAGIINGTDLQAFWILAAQTYPWPSKLPTITVDLYESGVFRQSLGTRTIRATDTEGGQVMCFPFDAANLSVSSGANIEVKISSTPRSNLSYVKVYSVVLATDRDARAGDSGWLTYTPFEGSGITYRPEVDGPGNVILYEFPTTYNPYYVHLHIRSSRSPTDYVNTREVHPPTHNYVQVGCLVIGEAWRPTINMSYGKLAGVVDSSPRKRTYGGGMFGSRRPTRRVVSLALGHAMTTEAHTILDRVLWRHGLMKPFVVSTTPDDATQSKATTIFGHLRNAENWLNVQPDEGYENNFSLEFEEVL